MTPQLSAFVAAGRAAELAHTTRHAHRRVDEQADKPVARRRVWDTHPWGARRLSRQI